MNLPTILRAFNSRNYRLFFGGQCVSLIGTWIQNVAISWLIYDITNSALVMGIMMGINTLPTLFIAPFAGVVIDRFNKYKMLVILQCLFMLQASLMAYFTLIGKISIVHIVVLGVFINILAAFDMPLRQSFVIQLVDNQDDLTNAISLNSTCFNFARLIGPAVAGILIAAVGVGYCFLINALSFIPVIWALLLMKISTEKHNNLNKKSVFSELKEGLKYVKIHPQIYLLLLLIVMVSLIGTTYPLLLPIYSKDILFGNAAILGFLMSAAGIGALIASLFIAAQTNVKYLPKFMCFGAMTLGVSYALMGFVRNLFVAEVLMFGVGFGMVAALISSNTLIQNIVADKLRGRVMSIHTIAFIGSAPVSSICAGTIAQHIGIMNTFILFGLLMSVVGIIFWKKISPLHFEKICDD